MYNLYITLFFSVCSVLMAESVNQDEFHSGPNFYNDPDPLVYIDGVQPLTLTKMARDASGDIKDYLIKQCGNYDRTDSCELFVAVEGNLIGYMTLRHYHNEGNNEFQGDVENMRRKSCWVGGFLPRNIDILNDFDEMAYINDANGKGVWRLVRNGNTIHMTNPKQNDCYKNQHIDVVWQRIAYLINR